MDVVGFSLIIDDIVQPDGRTCMAQLGGGGPQTLYGYQLATGQPSSARIGLAAGVGADLPPHCTDWLGRIGCDLSGLQLSDLPTPRAWQLLEEDGRRTEVWRCPQRPELYQQLRPAFESLPAAYRASRHYHLGIHPSHPPLHLLQQLRDVAHAQGGGATQRPAARVLHAPKGVCRFFEVAGRGLLSVEPFTPADSPPPREQLARLLALCDVFSPNGAEAASLVGPGTPRELVGRLVEAGATTVTLRMGAQGALAAHGPSGEAARVPAVPGLHVVDVTGCGNAFCGAFLAAWGGGRTLAEAAAWGCAAGSVLAEWQGVPEPAPRQLQQLAESRQQLVLRDAALQAIISSNSSSASTSSSGGGGGVGGCRASADPSRGEAAAASPGSTGRNTLGARAWSGRQPSTTLRPRQHSRRPAAGHPAASASGSLLPLRGRRCCAQAFSSSSRTGRVGCCRSIMIRG